MITLLPPTVGLKDSENSNWPFFAFYNRNHRFAAAVAAQEVREARYKASIWFPLVAVGVAVIVAAHVWFAQSLLYLPAAIIPASLVVATKARKRQIEIIGQSVECVVRRDKYGTPLEEALSEASRQLTRYKQFKGWTQEKIRMELVNAIPAAEQWARKNAGLIKKARALQ